jgi:hypothetical protein
LLLACGNEAKNIRPNYLPVPVRRNSLWLHH